MKYVKLQTENEKKKKINSSIPLVGMGRPTTSFSLSLGQVSDGTLADTVPSISPHSSEKSLKNTIAVMLK